VIRGGFPKSGLDAYVGRLVRAGHAIAIAWQDGNKQRHLSEVIRVDCDVIGEKGIQKGA